MSGKSCAAGAEKLAGREHSKCRRQEIDMWTIKRIDEADFGCEERLPGEPLMVLVSLECDDGRVERLEVADSWLTAQELDEGDEWPENLDEADASELRIVRQAQWMENYMDALEELDDSFFPYTSQ